MSHILKLCIVELNGMFRVTELNTPGGMGTNGTKRKRESDQSE